MTDNLQNLIQISKETGDRFLNIEATYAAYAETFGRTTESLSDFEKTAALTWASSILDTSQSTEKDDINKEEPTEEEPAKEDLETKEWNVEIFQKSQDKQLVYGVVYSPDEVDAQDDFADEEEIEKFAHSYLEQHFKNIVPANDLCHEIDLPLEKVCPVESYIAPVDIPVGENLIITKGSWVLVSKVYDVEIWQAIKKGDIKAYSMKGTGRRIPVEQ